LPCFISDELSGEYRRFCRHLQGARSPADEPKAPAFSEISYIQISDPPEFVSKYANDLADDG
jgi:hypothetical protein